MSAEHHIKFKINIKHGDKSLSLSLLNTKNDVELSIDLDKYTVESNVIVENSIVNSNLANSSSTDSSLPDGKYSSVDVKNHRIESDSKVGRIESDSKIFNIKQLNHIKIIIDEPIRRLRRKIDFNTVLKDYIDVKDDNHTLSKEFLEGFDEWILGAMNTISNENTFLYSIDKLFVEKLTKMVKLLSDPEYLKLLSLLDIPILGEGKAMKILRDRLKISLIALRQGIVDDVANSFNLSECNCDFCLT
jgi:hypothetical protein